MGTPKEWWQSPHHWPLTMKAALLSGLVALIVVWLACLSAVRYMEKDGWKNACATSSQYARLAAQSTAFRIYAAENLLHYLKHSVEATGQMPPLDPIVSWRDGIRYIYRMDDQGRIAHGLTEDATYLAHYLQHRNGSDLNAYIGKAVWDSGLMSWGLPVSMGLKKSDGSFDGAVIAILNISTLIREYDRVGAPLGTKIILVGQDFHVRAANSSAASEIFSGETADDDIFGAFSDGEEATTFASQDEDGNATVTSAHLLTDRRLAVRIDIPRLLLLPNEKLLTINSFFTAIVVSLIIAAALVAALRGLYLRHVASETLRENRDELQRMVEERTAELRESNEKLHELAYFDIDTQMPNRAAFIEQLSTEIYNAKSAKRRGSVVSMDIDDIHIIGNAFGRAACDEVIKNSARLLQEITPPDSFCAHFGSNEFYFICPSISDRQELAARLDEFCRAMRHEEKYNDLDVSVTATLGGAIYPDDGGDAFEALKSADSAMFFAKASGKGENRVFSPEMRDFIFDDVALTHEMKKALADGEFFLVFQPQVNAVTHKLTGYEALIRWDNPERGIVMPSRFIPLAEKNGLIQPIGKWVFAEACRFIKRLENGGHRGVTVSINVSAQQFAQPDFLATVAAVVNESGVDLAQIEIEVTESMLIQSLDAAISKLAAIRNSGMKVALDDFGTGYSSLNYLLRLPFDTLKIDKSFIDVIPDDEKGKELVKAIVYVSHTLGKTTIAEGVETAEQLAYLAENECDIIQGYYFSKPLPADKAIEFLEKV